MKEIVIYCVECAVGKGKAILSGVHCEYVVEEMSPEPPYLDKVVPLLQKTRGEGRMLFLELLERLGLVLMRDK